MKVHVRHFDVDESYVPVRTSFESFLPSMFGLFYRCRVAVCPFVCDPHSGLVLLLLDRNEWRLGRRLCSLPSLPIMILSSRPSFFFHACGAGWISSSAECVFSVPRFGLIHLAAYTWPAALAAILKSLSSLGSERALRPARACSSCPMPCLQCLLPRLLWP